MRLVITIDFRKTLVNISTVKQPGGFLSYFISFEG